MVGSTSNQMLKSHIQRQDKTRQRYFTVGVNVQLEASQNGDQIDEAYMEVGGGFGKIIVGDENSAMYKMHYSPSDFGIGLQLW